jgi:hypothetical protein
MCAVTTVQTDFEQGGEEERRKAMRRRFPHEMGLLVSSCPRCKKMLVE